MKKPTILVVDDDEQVLRAVVRDIRNAYGKDYRIVSSSSANECLALLTDLKNKGEVVALFLSDQSMPEMLGVEFLQKARVVCPQAKRLFLTAYSDTEAPIRAINDVQLDYYLMKPWDPPEEKLLPPINELSDDWQSNHVPLFHGIRIVGYQWSPRSHHIKDFLSGNLVPYQWLDVQEDKAAKELLDINKIVTSQLPAV